MSGHPYWEKQHLKYAATDWINKPSLFAEQVVQYFSPSGRLLDLGTGQGQDARFFARHGYAVTATDTSEQALKFAREAIAAEKLSIDLKNLDHSQPLPFADKSFEIVYSHLALHYFDNTTTGNIFSEIQRVLVPSGVVAMLLNTWEDPEVTESQKIEEGFYRSPDGLEKRFFTVEYLVEKIINKFEPILIDAQGQTYKDILKTLIRFVGKRIN